MGGRGRFGALLVLIIAASCSQPRPTVDVSIAGTPIRLLDARCEDTGCGGPACPPPGAMLTVVRASPPIRLDFSADDAVTEISISVWRGETMMGTATESVIVPSEARSWTSRAMTAGRYYLILTASWSRRLDRGLTTRAFLVEIVPP